MSNLIYLNTCSSTNDEILLHYHSTYDDFSCVYTFNQTLGRGQNGNIWKSNSNENLAISFIVQEIPSFEPTFFSFFIAAELRKFMEEKSLLKTEIKWTNDIIIFNKKVAGILIEKHRHHIIIGIGINVNQKDFQNLPKASSLKNLTSQEFELHLLALELQQFFQHAYQKIEFLYLETYEKNLICEYNQHLFRKGKVSVFKHQNLFKNGIIQEVLFDGTIKILFDDNNINSFKNKEIELIY